MWFLQITQFEIDFSILSLYLFPLNTTYIYLYEHKSYYNKVCLCFTNKYSLECRYSEASTVFSMMDRQKQLHVRVQEVVQQPTSRGTWMAENKITLIHIHIRIQMEHFLSQAQYQNVSTNPWMVSTWLAKRWMLYCKDNTDCQLKLLSFWEQHVSSLKEKCQNIQTFLLSKSRTIIITHTQNCGSFENSL